MHQRIASFLVLGLFCVTAVRQAAAQTAPPSIIFQPTNRVSSIGGAATFIVTASGSNLVYRWRREGIPLSNGTNRLLSLINLSNGNAGAYTVVVTNFYGSVTSQPAMLTLTGAPPRIYLQPTNSLVCPGGPDAVLRVQASGSPPFNYVWLHEGSPVAGQTSDTFRMAGDLGLVGNYAVIVANGYGSETSQVARLELGPIILQQPASQIALASSNVLFQVNVAACSGTRYQWRFNGQDIPGGTNAGLYYRSPDIEHEGNYDVVVSDNFRSVTSAVARLTVLRHPPQLFSQPIDFIETLSTNILFAVTFTGAPWPSFQWYRNGVAIPGENGYQLRFMAYPWLQGDYWVVLSNSVGQVTSRAVRFSVPWVPPIAEDYPTDRSYCPEKAYNPPARLRMAARSLGAAPTYFQWFKEGSPLAGQTNEILPLAEVPSPLGDYAVEFWNFTGITNRWPVSVSYGIAFAGQPEDLLLLDGHRADFYATVHACEPFTLQWFKDGVELPGQTSESFSIPIVGLGDAGDYWLVAQHGTTSVTSRVARLDIEPFDPVIFDGYPLDHTANAGDGVFLSFEYEIGFPPANIQWHFNGRPIPGETNDVLEFLAQSPAQHGRYSVTLSNVNTVVTSRLAKVQIFFSPPIFDTDPEDVQAPLNGGTIWFYTYAIGLPPPQYQWLFNGAPLRGQTNEWLEVELRTTNQVGGYSVVASNFLGSVTSLVATLSAELYPPVFENQPANQSVSAGENVYLYGYANGSPQPHLQWYHDGVPVPGANDGNLYFQAGYLDQAGGYYLVASNYLGTATSAVAQVNILVVPPRIVVHPVPQQLVVGETLGLHVTMSNNIPARLQWHRDGSALPGETNYIFQKATTTTNDSGEYHVTAWNNGGTDTSRVARVEVRLPGALDRWSWRHSLPQGNHLTSAAHGNGRHVAVGDAGAVIASTNGTDWIDLHKSGYHSHLLHLCFGNGRFVAYDYRNGRFVNSTNGVDWSDEGLQIPQIPTGIQRLAFGNGRFVADDYESKTYLSTNGTDWEVRTLDEVFIEAGATEPQGWYLHEIVFAHDRFVASFELSNSDLSGVLTSTNGIDWQSFIFPNSGSLNNIPINTAAFGNDRYVALLAYDPLHVLISTNGREWSVEDLPAPSVFTYYQSIAFGAGRFVRSLYGSDLETSVDGLNWTGVPGFASNFLSQVYFHDNRFIAVGDHGALATSTNGLDWLRINPGSSLNLRGITRADNLFVAVGNEGLIYTSANGLDWTRRDLGTNFNFRAVTHFKGRYIAVGEQDDFFPSERVTIYTSPDAIHWQPAPSVGLSGRADLYSLAHNEHTIVAVGNNSTVAVSQDGLNWNDAVGLPVSRDLNAVIWNGSAFYAAGKDGAVLSSLDGLSWFSLGPGGSRNLHGIAYGNGILVTVANGGRYFVGNGNGSWQRYDWRSTEDLSDIIFAGGRFVAVGDNGIMHTSTDGTNWTRRVNPSGNDLRGVIYSEGSYWVVGNNETILQSSQVDPALRIHRIAGSRDVALELLGEAGLGHRLQGSHNFNVWADILTFTAGPEPQLHHTPDPNAGGWRFYRVVTP